MKLTIPINSSRLAKLAMLTSTMILTSPYGAATDRLIAHGGNSSLDNGQSIIHTSKNDSLNRLAGDAPNSSNSLSANQQLNTNEYLASSNDNYRLYMQSDGNLVLRETATSSALWASGTSGTGAVRIHFQGDGNLVMRDGNSSSVWSSASHNQGGDRLVLNNNGSLVIYAGDNVIWYQGNLPPVNSSPTDVATGNDFELNESLYADDVIFSSNNDYKLTMQGDGNLVLRNNVTSSAIWASGTSGTAASYVRFQGDGNFIIFDDNGNSVWKSNTEFDNADSIILHDNGALVMYSSATVVWSVGNTPPVIDTTPPMISLNGANTIALEVGDNYSDAGATATDDTDGDVSSFITTTGSVNTNITGTYTLSYDVSDSAGNAATTVYRNIIVSNPPTGDTPTSTNSLGPDTNLYTDEYLESTNGDYRLYMQGDGNLVLRNTATNSPLWSSDTVGTGAIRIRFQGDGNLVMRNAGGAAVWSTGTSGSGGDYIVVNGNGSLVIYDGVNVVWSVGNPPPTGDSTAPIISLNGSSTVDINQYDSYTDAGATATDNQDGDLSANIQVTGSVNTNIVGTYTVSYNVTDSTGNQADTVNRTVNVIWGGGTDTIAPMISLVGNSIVNIIEGSSYNDAGATASDNADGDISNQVVTQGSVDIFTPASYTLTYSVSDAAGNIATPVTRTVNVLSNSGNSGGAVTQGNGRFSAPSAALYGLNDSNARVADRYIDTNWGGNGHAQSWDGRLFVRATSSGWLADAFRPERVSKNTDGTPNFGGAFSGRVLLEAKVSTKTSGTNTHHNWLAIIPDPEHTGKNPYRSNASGSASSSGSYETYKTVVYHTAEEYNGNGDRTRKDSIGFRKATFIINNAKTSNATVTHASFTSNFQYMRMTNSNTIYCIEPSVTNDGRLIICQGSRDQNGNIDHLIYSYNQNPAVINGWSVAKNLSQMHYDDRNTNIAGLPFYQRYPIAEFAIKEASGRILSNGETIRGAYPWISRDGSELFYQHSRRRDGSSNANPGARRTGTAVVGRWTGGIIRHIDGSINRSRYNHSRLFLSSTGAFTTMWSAFKDLQDPILPYSLRGASYGLFHSNGEGYHEVGFEDFLDGNYIMYLGMNEQLPVDNGNQEHMINNTPDTSGHFNNGILVGAKFPYEYDGGDTLDGIHGQAIHFQNNDYVNINKTTGWDQLNDAFTIELAVRKLSGSGTMPLFTLENGIEIYLSGGSGINASVTDNTGNRINIAGSTVTTNQWKHIAIVYNRSTSSLKLYANGTLVSDVSTTSLVDLDTTGDVNIGLRNSSGHVIIDEVRVSNVARLAYEIAYAANQQSNVEPNNALSAKIPDYLSSLSRYATGVTNYSDAAASLGNTLFNDQILSLNNATSCATCHNPSRGFSETDAIAQGNEPTDNGIRNASSLINRLFSSFQGWGGVALSLESQAAIPISAAHEMNLPIENAVARLNADANYVNLFQNAFGQTANATNLTQALAAFQATQFAPKVGFDDYRNGIESALTAQQIRGLELFEGKARCSGCHAGVNFTDESFRNTGLVENGDNGRGGETGRERDHNLFKVPTLRQVNQTAPYMHDGSMTTLEEVVEKYNEGPFIGDMIDTDIRPLKLTAQEEADLVAFLKSL